MTRTRDKSTVSTVTITTVDTVGSVSTPSTSTLLVTHKDVMDDVVTPRYRSRSAAGEVIVSPMTKVTTTPSVPPVNYWKARQVPGGTRRAWSRTHHPLYPNDLPWLEAQVVEKVSTLETLAITKAYSRVGSADVESLVELAELRETLSFLGSPVRAMKNITRRLLSHIRKVKRLQDNFAKRLAKWEALPERVRARRSPPVPPRLPVLRLSNLEVTDIPSAWLAYRYAIMPLIYSFQDLQKHLQRTEFPTRETARAKEEGEVDMSVTGNWTQYDYPNGNVYERIRREGTVRIKCRAGVMYQPDWSMTRQLGLGLSRVPAALYEAIPLSFVTDWFHNGKEVYDAVTAECRALRINGAWVTTEIEADHRWYLDAKPADSYTTCSSGGLATTFDGKWKGRRVVSLSDVGFRFRMELNSKRIADGLSLIALQLATARKLSSI